MIEQRGPKPHKNWQSKAPEFTPLTTEIGDHFIPKFDCSQAESTQEQIWWKPVPTDAISVVLALVASSAVVRGYQPSVTELFRLLRPVPGTVYRSMSHPCSHCQSSAVVLTHISSGAASHDYVVVPEKWHCLTYLLTYFSESNRSHHYRLPYFL